MNRKDISLLLIGLSLGALLFAVCQWGVIYAHSKGLDADARGDAARARAIWRVTAWLGYTPSKSVLGAYCLTGRGGPVDPRLANEYLKDAAEAGDADAQSLYGIALATGVNLPRDLERGIYWMRKAAQQGDRTARDFLERLPKAQTY